MNKIKIELVEIFSILEKKEMEEEYKKKYELLKKIYQKINMNEKLIMKLNKEINENEGEYYKLTIFNKTNFEELYKKMKEEEKTELINKFKYLKEKTFKLIMEGEDEEHKCNDKCSHNNIFDTNELMNNKKMQKILNNKKLKYNLEQQLRKTTGMKNSSLEEILKENIPKEQKKMIDTLLKNDTIKKISEKVLNEENLLKIKDLFLEVIEREEVKKELDKIKCIIDENNFIETIKEIYEEFQKTKNLKDIEKLVKDNEKLQKILIKLDNSLKNDEININIIKEMIKNIGLEFIEKIKGLKIIDDKDIKNIKNLGGNLSMLSGIFSNEKKEDKKNKEENKKKRREKAKKEYRRKLRSQLKNSRKQKKKNKKPRGGSV